MVSHKKLSGLEITLGKSGLRFKKRPSEYNICVGKKMKESGAKPIHGKYDKAFQDVFTKSAKACAEIY